MAKQNNPTNRELEGLRLNRDTGIDLIPFDLLDQNTLNLETPFTV